MDDFLYNNQRIIEDRHSVPEVASKVEIELGHGVEPVVVSVEEQGSDEVARPSCHADLVTVSDSIREAPERLCLLLKLVFVLFGDAVDLSRVYESRVGDVVYLRRCLRVVRASRNSTV